MKLKINQTRKKQNVQIMKNVDLWLDMVEALAWGIWEAWEGAWGEAWVGLSLQKHVN